MSWTVASGQPYTPVVGKVFHGGDNLDDPYGELINIQGRRNSSRVPLYVRGDLSWVRSVSPFGVKGKFRVQVMNFTNHYNVLMYLWNHESGRTALSPGPSPRSHRTCSFPASGEPSESLL